MVDNFLSAGTQDDEEMPSPYGTGPSNRTTEEQRRSDYDSDPWRDRASGLGLDPSPSLPNAPRQFERGPVPQQPYVPKSPYLPASPPAQPPQQQRYAEEPQGYGQPPYQQQEQNPFRPQQPPAQPQQPPQNRQASPFAPTNGSNGVPPNRQAPSGPPPQQAPRPPAPPASNGSSNWSSPAPTPMQNGAAPTNGLSQQPPTSYGQPPPGRPPAHQPSALTGVQPIIPPQPPSQQPIEPPQQQPVEQAQPQQHQPVEPPQQPVQQRPQQPPAQTQQPAQPQAQQPAPPPVPPAPQPAQNPAPASAPDTSYLSDPSAEYESNTPISEPSSGRRVGARRRADVQQDAPSQVAIDHVASHRAARRAQPSASTASEGAPAESRPTEKRPPEGGGSGGGSGSGTPRRYRVHHLRDMKNRGEKWAMLTAYDQYTAEIFDQAGIPVLLVGDSAANNVFGYDTTLRVTVDELIPLARAVANAVDRALVVADLPFGSYQASPEQAFHTAVRFMKEAGVHAVKLEGGRTVVPMVEKLTQSGIPVMAHIGFTPQSEHSIGGYRVQGRGDQAAGLIDDAVALAEAGAFSLVLEMVPGDVAAEITKRVPIPTVGIGAGRDTDAQVLVWQDMAGLRSGAMPRFVKQYADLRGILTGAVTAYVADVASGAFPGDEHTF
ncbi:3-methyl-2-oxobutanoate hydroxymethyltransferase [Kribbella sandramycini]|uniref:3-methyl-2-oxobutanoate hydroxymethyltransferase n=1 Tax=Kribbella sandramycini TaxID=60450 RepID=A0A841S833_9ACTN|nr:3-methyl-2-oxobutanoate hydroxymethyltransferase [Kribbella sandramycini]MBB6568298.1 3-methyl-2-oxobutanoate hydroxymethyltransferase [Kribbella sandramycini]